MLSEHITSSGPKREYYSLPLTQAPSVVSQKSTWARVLVATAAVALVGVLALGATSGQGPASFVVRPLTAPVNSRVTTSSTRSNREVRAHAFSIKKTAATALGVATLMGSANVPPVQAAAPVEQAQVAPVQNTFARSGTFMQAPDLRADTEELNQKLEKGGNWRYSTFLSAVDAGLIDKAAFAKDGTSLIATKVNGDTGKVSVPNDPTLVDLLARKQVDISIIQQSQADWITLAGNLGVPLLFFTGMFLIVRRQQGGGMAGMPGGGDFGKTKANFQEVANTGVKFADVAGVEGAKLELREVVDFLKEPEKYTKLGAKIPTGALLVGPPGTGKTLLAKAVAGEAGVPFFACSASEFVELFVGVGASRVRDLFKKAKETAPCIIFIDEIDAVGRQRGSGMGGGNDEREQTINQLLTEMDGFETNAGVIILAATNRADVLDQALLRPGRFDRQITVDVPDLEGRTAILKVHSSGKTLASDVDLMNVARRCPGFSGADLANLMNEAAILTARRALKEIAMKEIEDALEKIVAGAEKVGAVMTDEKRKLVAYHEAGHALVGALMPDYDQVAKISIVPRGAAGGLTFFAPAEERLESGLYSRGYLQNQMAVALGGRIAEELIFGEGGITTGASNDFMQVSRTAKLMVTQLGFSEAIGQVALGGGRGGPNMGASMGMGADYSGRVASLVDAESKSLVETAYRRAKDLITTNIDSLHGIAEALLDKEVIDGREALAIITANGGSTYMRADAPGVTIPYQQ